MRKVLGIILYVIAGFFVYMVCLLSFVNQPALPKWGIIAGFTFPAILSFCLGLVVNRFRSWKRHLGIVLLSGTGITFFIVFTFVFFLMTDEFKAMMQPDTLEFFDAYVSGFTFTFVACALGILLIKTAKRETEPLHAGDTEKPRL